MFDLKANLCVYMFTDTEADLTEIVNRVQRSTHQAVAHIEVW